jgi:glycerol-3-phosphate dehydrogenase (NAD(P)+)
MIGIIGAGAMGSALAIHLHRAGREVALFATEYDEQVVAAHLQGKPHPGLGVDLPDVALLEPASWNDLLGDLDIAVLAVSTAGLIGTVQQATPAMSKDSVWAIATKGWDAETLRPAAHIVADETSEDRVVAIVGPSLAAEIARATPTALVCAAKNADAATKVADAFRSPTMRTYTSDDVIGVEVGAIMKNIVAIAVGILDGVGGDATSLTSLLNTKAFVFSRGLIEMSVLAETLGGRAETILGLTGAGDLFVTALGGRNGRFGRLLGTGFTPTEALAEMNTTVEGYHNARSAVALAEREGIDLPLVRAIASILYDSADPAKTLEALFEGPVGPER